MNEEKNISVIPPDMNDFIDAVEQYMVDEMVGSGEFQFVELPLVHRFTKGLYSRQITMFEGNRITSKIHLTDHQFIISKGKCSVFNNGEEVVLEAPYHGITKAGTRRILYIHEECIWTTFHATDIQPENDSEEAIEEAVAKIEDLIIEKHENKLLSSSQKLIP